MYSLSLGPLALPVAPLLLIGSVGLGAWVAGQWARRRLGVPSDERPGDELIHAAWWGLLWARLVHVGLHADLYLAQPLAMVDVRDGGWHAWSGWVAALAWLLWKAWRHPAWRQALGVGAVTGTLLWGGATWALNPNSAKPFLPDVTVHSESNGTVQSLPMLGRGQLRVINLWASWCGPCRQEMPLFAALQATEADVQFLFINQGESVQDVRAYLQSAKLSLQGVWLDPSSALGPAVGVAGLPATLFVNADGQIVEVHFGVLSEPALKARLRALREAP
ncbi:MAG: TlpA disulfide reductase family protein [Aquabacterium sp.]